MRTSVDNFDIENRTDNVQFQVGQIRTIVNQMLDARQEWRERVEAKLDNVDGAFAGGDSIDLQAAYEAALSTAVDAPTIETQDFEDALREIEDELRQIDGYAFDLSHERDELLDEVERLEDVTLEPEDILDEAEGRMLTDSDSDVLAWLLARLRGRVTDRTLTLVG